MWEDEIILKNIISGNYSQMNFGKVSQVAAETQNQATI